MAQKTGKAENISYFSQAEIAQIRKHHTRELTKKNCRKCGGYLTVTARFDGFTFAGSCGNCGYKYEWELLTGNYI